MAPTVTRNECPICHSSIQNPIVLKCCKAKFCTECLDGWKPGLDGYSKGRTCPCCRARIPPTQDVLDTVQLYKEVSASIRAQLRDECHEIATPPFQIPLGGRRTRLTTKYKLLEKAYGEPVRLFERNYGKSCGNILDKTPPKAMKLPNIAAEAVTKNDTRDLKNYLGKFPIPPRRLNAICHSKNGNTLLHLAVKANNLDFVKTLLCLGANVEAVNFSGKTPLYVAAITDGVGVAIAKELLCWGAEKQVHISGGQVVKKGPILTSAETKGKVEFAQMLRTLKGGRHCTFKYWEKEKQTRGTIVQYTAFGGHYSVKRDNSTEFLTLGKDDFQVAKPLHFVFS